MRIRTAAFCVVMLFCGCGSAVMQAASPREPLAVPDPTVADRLDAGILRQAADEALAEGLPSVARDLYLRIGTGDATGNADPDITSGLARSYLAMGQGAEAEKVLQNTSTIFQQFPWWRLEMALAQLQQGLVEEARQRLTPPLDDSRLDPALGSWLHFAQGLLKSSSGDYKGAAAEYDKAAQGLPQVLGPQVGLLEIRDQIRSSRADADQLTALRDRLHDQQGQRSGFETARLLALALSGADRRMEALSVLDEQLQYIAVDEDGMRGQLLVLLGHIAGPETTRGRTALQQALMNPQSSLDVMEKALGMLCSVPSQTGSAPLREILDEIITKVPLHPLMDELLLLRSDLSMQTGRIDDASADAQRIIDQYPASSLRHAAMRSLAYIAFLRNPPQYRTAASYLAQLRAELPQGPDRASTGVYIADCFFLNGDDSNAADSYQDTMDEPVPDKGVVFYQLILSLLNSGRMEDARTALDAVTSDSGIDPMHRWKAEWNYLHSLRETGHPDEAFSRIEGLLSDTAAASAPPQSLRLRLMWLEAQLSLDAGHPDQTPQRCHIILGLLETVPEADLEAGQRVLIASQTLLLEAQSLMSVGDETQAGSVLDTLRTSYPDSVAAQNSYLAQARFLSSRERLVEAQRFLLVLADRYPQSDQASVALWEAAICAEQRGLEATYREAISLLDRLVSSYPKSDLVFYARLRQGDILRKLNDFGTALLAYEDVINRFPQQPDLYLAQMSRADCIIAQSANNPVRRADGVAIYERLMELNDAPVDFRVEASFKWAYNLDKQGDSSRAIDAYWLTLNRYLAEDTAPSMKASGRYWVARCAVELGQLLEAAGRYGEARRVYTLMLTSNLPGRALAQARLKRLDEPRAQQ